MPEDDLEPRDDSAPGDALTASDIPPGEARVVRLSFALALGAILVVVAVGGGAIAAWRLSDLTGDLAAVRTERDTLDLRVQQLISTNGQLVERITDIDSQISGLVSEVHALEAEVQLLRAENASLEEQLLQLQNPDVAELIIVFGSAFRFCRTCFGAGEFLLVVDLTVSNPDTEDIAFFSTSSFKLKGPDNTVYPLLADSPVGRQPRFISGVTGLPDGRIEIRSQALEPGEVIRGVVVFYVTAAALETFVISYDEFTAELKI